MVVGRGREGNLILRLVDSLLGERGRPDPVQLGRLLGDMGLEASPGNIRLAAELLRQGFAVTPDTLALLGRALGQGEPSPAEAAALVWLWGQGLPLKETFVKPLVTLFQEAGPDLLQELFPALAALQGEGQEEGQGLLQQLLLSPAREGGRTLQDLPRLLGLDYENLVLRSLFSREGPGELPAGDAAAPVGKLPAQKSLKSFLLALGQGEEGKLPAELEGLLAKITGLQLLTAGPWSLHCLGWLDLPRQAAPFFPLHPGGGAGEGRGAGEAPGACPLSLPPCPGTGPGRDALQQCSGPFPGGGKGRGPTAFGWLPAGAPGRPGGPTLACPGPALPPPEDRYRAGKLAAAAHHPVPGPAAGRCPRLGGSSHGR